MHKVVCVNHHHYDADLNKVCPHCGSAERINENAMDADSIGGKTWLGKDGTIYSDFGNTTGIEDIEKTISIDDIEATVAMDANQAQELFQRKEKRCCNCFKTYHDIDGICPHCGYTENEGGKEPHYLKPGTILEKRYIIGQALGAGGFGITYLAWDNTVQNLKAIKEYFPAAMVSRTPGEKKVTVFSSKKENDYVQGLREFLGEAKMMAKFSKNENVCNTYEFFEENNTAYIVMELLAGSSLKDHLKNGGYWPNEEESVNIILQVLSGLEEIHKKGIVHLDIAPDNIWLLPNGKVKIIDFGAACEMTGRPKTRGIVVKRGFAPYEQYLDSGRLGPWTDIYAAGATLYYLLTKKVPLESSDRYFKDELEAPVTISLASQSVSDAVMRAMAVQYELRYRNVKEFADDLKRDKVRTYEKELKRRKRRRRNTMLSVIVLSLALIIGCGYITLHKNMMLPGTVVVWLLAEDTPEKTSGKQKRYEESIALFHEQYPQINVELVVKHPDDMEYGFLNTEGVNRPDLLEVSESMQDVLSECISLKRFWISQNEYLTDVVYKAVLRRNSNLCPLGIDVTVLFAEKGKDIGNLTEKSLEDFLSSGTGYTNANSSDYFVVRDRLAGRYSVFETVNPQIVLTENFSVYHRSEYKEKIALALLSYLLSDAAQDILHIQNESTSMPVSREAWKAYLEIYTEFDYLEKSIKNYSVSAEQNE